jgi:hypothetical protein
MASRHDLTIDQGSTFNLLLEVQDVNSASLDLTGMTFASQARESFDSPNISFAFTCSVLHPTSGQFYLNLPADASTAVSAGRYVYDIEMTSGSVVTRIVQGTIDISPEVTR